MPNISARYRELAASSKRELESVFAAGSPPDVAAITGFEFLGYNHPPAASLLGIRKFIKVFYLDGSQQAFGCNTPVSGSALDQEWSPRPSRDQPKRYAFFKVEPADPDADDSLHQAAVLLDYGRGGNKFYDVSRILRDYLVRVEPDSDDLLLGKAFFVIAGARVASSFFLIQRSQPLPDAADLARRPASSRVA
jgi:hypothetical protein